MVCERSSWFLGVEVRFSGLKFISKNSNKIRQIVYLCNPLENEEGIEIEDGDITSLEKFGISSLKYCKTKNKNDCAIREYCDLGQEDTAERSAKQTIQWRV